MNFKIVVLAFLAILAGVRSSAQLSGNQVYGTAEPAVLPNSNPEMVARGDSALVISGDVLLNAAADTYRVTLGVSQEGKTVAEVNEKITARIESFKRAVSSLGVTEKDWWVDFIAQVKTFEKMGASGFEVKKNIILMISRQTELDQIMVKAAESGIYDLVKVDLIVRDLSAIYRQAVAAAADVIRIKKEMYQKISSFEFLPGSRVFSEDFYANYPDHQYKSYSAFEASDAKYKVIRELERTEKTFYFDGISPAAFDAVINPASPVIGVQYVLRLRVLCDIKPPR